MKRLKRVSFFLLGAMMAVLTAATVVERLYGTEFAGERIYGSFWFCALWGVLAAVSMGYVLLRRLDRRPAVFLIHLSLAVILLGAGVTHFWGQQGSLHLRVDDQPAVSFTLSDGSEAAFPFAVRLDAFRVKCYPGTRTPMDYVSSLWLLADDRDAREGEVAMNRIMRYRGYRFYQSAYDEDGQGTTLAVAWDPIGIALTYTGYGMLFLAMVALVFGRQGGFRRLLRHPALRRLSLCALCAVGVTNLHAAQGRPGTLPRRVADELGDLYVYHNDRICPLSTMARDVTVKLYGKSRYKGLTAEQVLSGWIFWYDDWKREPMIRIKSADVRRSMGIEGRYARLVDFTPSAEQAALPGADEKFRIAGMVATGSMLRVFPYTDRGELHWASQVDGLPQQMEHEQWLFIRRAMDYLYELVVKRDYDGAVELIRKIRAYQLREAAGSLPSDGRFRAEKIYNRIEGTLPLAAGLVLAGCAGFLVVCRRIVSRRRAGEAVARVLTACSLAALLYLTFALVLRGYVSGHWPLSNGYETMQAMAWCVLLLTVLFRRRFALLIPFGQLVGGLALMVSAIGSSDPQITQLMPVLASPLLSVHVMLVMVSYSLFALILFNGAAGLWLLGSHPEDAEALQVTGRLMLYPAVFFLAAGIFVGAIWANVSWGRYWGWDPKEVWALITLLAYSLPLHAQSLLHFRRPGFFHAYCVVAFLCVLVTYFGVNLLLGGMHSYAG